MKIFKRTKAKKDAKIAEGIKSLTDKFKLKDKIAKANQWADNQPMGRQAQEESVRHHHQHAHALTHRWQLAHADQHLQRG